MAITETRISTIQRWKRRCCVAQWYFRFRKNSLVVSINAHVPTYLAPVRSLITQLIFGPSSSIVEDLQSLVSADSKAVLVYFYFDFNDASKQKVSSFICTLLAQFIQPGKLPPKPISDLHGRYKNINSAPPVSELMNTLLSTSKLYSKVYLVCDALDECTERRLLLDMLRDLIRQRPPCLNMLFTSRQERDIRVSLNPLITHDITIRATDIENDIRLYVSNVLQRDENLRALSSKLHQDIKEDLAAKAEGM